MTDEAPVSFQVRPVPPAIVPAVWPQVLPMIKAALAHSGGEREPGDILQMLTTDAALLWLVMDPALVGCCVTNVAQWPRKKIATAIIIAGDGWDDWGASLAEAVIAWARDLGCDALDGWGRDGWPKKLTPLGFKRLYQVVRLEL